MKTNFYKVLSLESETASIDEIKMAYRSLARRYHPDVCPPSKKEESTKMFIELRQAYETLSNPTLRSMHDNELRIKCCRERWQAQLHELRLRSDRREKLKSNGN
ncbi:DnaJ domain-containing protein [Dioscorea alata]|uniref:DnaJ domain-containing protein n=1 Tax=Dioscorea alata TaxID=55571 RepID=A0ACB7TXE9_DIOAL|nr:DnaJ domain-containing protein [Dioscorea alata]